jgi:hypothetical protein
MNNYILRLYEDRLPPFHAPVYLPSANRSIFVKSGDVTIETRDGCQYQTTLTGWVGSGELSLIPGSQGATICRWELVSCSNVYPGELRSSPFCESELKLDKVIELDPSFSWLMRCDSVEFPPGGVALTHVHQGPGIRYVLKGEIIIKTEGEENNHGPADAWFEQGPAPVLAPTTEKTETSFVRCFILPSACKGRSSIRYVRSEDAKAHKVQTYHVYAEQLIDLP